MNSTQGVCVSTGFGSTSSTSVEVVVVAAVGWGGAGGVDRGGGSVQEGWGPAGFALAGSFVPAEVEGVGLASAGFLAFLFAGR